ncbi:uncharacterized protein LOC125808482 [Solanum verrucosum]|uniref:uncharacterized protein LOC125808482 n=1 Tax=Solanum verrucosum TaxID=315347 RepID=UPI0020D145BC|nr:uncharacterized protein LOC125808482 [Solanum verrucosum]
MANSFNLRPQGGLPGDTEPNPKQLHAVSTRSGLQLEELAPQKRDTEVSNKEKKVEEVVKSSNAEVHINLPLVDILQGIPKYAKYVKDIVESKMRLTEYETIALTEERNSRIQNRLPKKLKGPGSFTVQITIGQSVHARGLCDLGVSINLMLLSLYKKFGLGSPKRTTVILQLADRSIARPDEVVEDVLLQVGSLIFSVDFVVLDFEPDSEVPFILGRPFLAMGRALVDVAAGQLTMRAHDKVKVFDVYHGLKLPSIYEELSAIIVVDRMVESQVVVPEDRLERVLEGHEIEGDTEAQEIESCLNLALVDTRRNQVESLDRELAPPPKPSIEEARTLELKALLAHLRYAYLGTNETLPVILFAELFDLQVDAALRILKRRRKAIGWQMANIHGISVALCMHKIYMEEDHKPKTQHQRQLNLVMKEVVRKEVIKCLDAGIVYPISDTKWVSPVQCVPKKVGFYRRFIKDFSKIARLMCSLLEKEVKFDFDEMCLKAFEMLKRNLIEAPILIAPDWGLPFELICDASDIEMGAVLGQRKNKVFHSIYYASKTLDSTQANYTVTEKEMLALVFAFDKFISYLVGTKVIVFTDHAAIRYLFNKKGAIPRLEDFSHVNEGEQIREQFPDEQLMALDISQVPWYADIMNFIVSGDYPPGSTTQQKKKLNHDAKFYIWDEPFLFK